MRQPARRSSNRPSAWLAGLGLGAAAVYLYDSRQGARRRADLRDRAADIRDRMTDVMRRTGEVFGAASRDVAHRAQALWGRRREQAPAEPQGQAKRGESSEPPVVRPHEPELNFELAQDQWSSPARMLVGLAGAGCLVYSLSRRRPLSTLVGLAGAGLITRAATNCPLSRSLGIMTGQNAVEIEKTVEIQAPVATVFEFWCNARNFPQLMSHVREVKETGFDQSHWVVSGPAGVPIEWDAVMTRLVEDRLLAWKTIPGSIVQHAGIIQFQPIGDRATEVRVRMQYNPGAGLAHTLAALLGADPKRRMDQDLARVKAFLEQPQEAGKPVAKSRNGGPRRGEAESAEQP